MMCNKNLMLIKNKKWTIKLRLSLITLGIWVLPAMGQQLADKTGYLNEPYLEWEIQWNYPEGEDPYEVMAKAIFTNTSINERKISLMYYAGDNTWGFRFTGTRIGTWNLMTSGPGNLGGHTATIDINPAPEERLGFLTASGKKWIWDGMCEPHLPQLVMARDLNDYWTGTSVATDLIDADVKEFIRETGFTGFHLWSVAGHWFNINSSTRDTEGLGSDVYPDPNTFKTLEEFIMRVYHAGASTHIWLWGSDGWGGCSGLKGIGGAMSSADRRFLRYIAARLGPIPGWSMGYGFDLQVWADANELQTWYDFFKSHLGGWKHLIGARADVYDVTNAEMKRLINEGGEMNRRPLFDVYWSGDYVGYYDYRVGYPWYVYVREFADKPHFQEDRFRVRVKDMYKFKDYTPNMTVRGLWHSTMAGGMANIWGNLLREEEDDRSGSYPYDNKATGTIRDTKVKVDIKDDIKTYSTFWFDKGRFSYDYIRDNRLTGNQPGDDVLSEDGQPISVCLRDETYDNYVFYSEDAEKIIMDLGGSRSLLRAIAVDTHVSYKEIEIGMVNPEEIVWEVPYKSDWAIAVGDFNHE